MLNVFWPSAAKIVETIPNKNSSLNTYTKFDAIGNQISVNLLVKLLVKLFVKLLVKLLIKLHKLFVKLLVSH